MRQLKITKPDGTIHLAPITALSRQLELNAWLPVARRAQIEEVDAQGAVLAVHQRAAAVETVIAQKSTIQQKDAEIEDLRQQLDELKAKKTKTKE